MQETESSPQSDPPPKYSQPAQYSQPPGVVQPQWGYPQPQMGYQQPVVMQPQQSSVNTTTVVVNNQPAAPVHKPLRSWSTGICAICDDCAVCWCVICCQPCAECSLAMDMGENCCLPYCVPGWLIALRTKIRTQHNIHGSIMDDCCLVYWCYHCALCQTMREVKITRGT